MQYSEKYIHVNDVKSRNSSQLRHLYILNAVRCPSVRSFVTLGVASSVANDLIMRTGAASTVRARRANDVIMR